MELGKIGVVVVVLVGIISYNGFTNRDFQLRYLFNVGSILQRKQYIRLLSSGFLHNDWSHLIFNMLTFFFFAPVVENEVGSLAFAILYVGALLGGNLFSLFVNRKNALYSALGASGAVSGVLFGYVALFPSGSLMLMFIPIPIPGWVFGMAYILYSIYGMKANRDLIGHEAHLGGAISGVVLAMLIKPEIIQTNWLTLVLILIPALILFLILVVNPNALEKDSIFKSKHKLYDPNKKRKR